MACPETFYRGRWFPWLGALLAMGCAHGPRPPCDNPPPIYVALQGSKNLNPDEQRRPLVTQVFILQVKGTARLDDASLNDLLTKPQEALGEEFINANETAVEPSKTTTVGYRRDARATAVVVVANFRQPSGTSWRATAKLPPIDLEKCPEQPVPPKDSPTAGDTVLTFSLEDVRVTNLTPAPKGDGK